jgi:hypothetical protein
MLGEVGDLAKQMTAAERRRELPAARAADMLRRGLSQ